MSINLTCGCKLSLSNDHILEWVGSCEMHQTPGGVRKGDGESAFTLEDLRVVARYIMRSTSKKPSKLLGRWGGGPDRWGNE